MNSLRKEGSSNPNPFKRGSVIVPGWGKAGPVRVCPSMAPVKDRFLPLRPGEATVIG